MPTPSINATQLLVLMQSSLAASWSKRSMPSVAKLHQFRARAEGLGRLFWLGPRYPSSNLRRSSPLPDVRQCRSAVVPAQAGTHTPQQGDVAGPVTTEALVVMGPRLRGDDSG